VRRAPVQVGCAVGEVGHVHRGVLRATAGHSKLPGVILAPALDPSPAQNRARVIVPHGDDAYPACQSRPARRS
jgi:hypothetical protein